MKRFNQTDPYDRPREKLLRRGPESLQDEELLAALLGSGIPGKDVLSLSREILKRAAGDPEFFSVSNLSALHGMGVARACQLSAAFTLAKRFIAPEKVKITSADEVARQCADLTTKKQEHFVILTLDGGHHLIGRHTVFIGTLNYSLVHPREVFAEAIGDRAAAFIAVHNHPSGLAEPSENDIALTRRLVEVGKLVGIELLDHVIITKNGHYSLNAHGMI